MTQGANALATRPAAPSPVRELMGLGLTMSAAQLSPLLASVYLGGLLVRQGALPFSSYSLVGSINLTAFLTMGSSLQSLYYVAGSAVGRDDEDGYRAALRAGLRLALSWGLVCACISASSGALLWALHMDRDLVRVAAQIGLTAALGIPPSMLMVVYRVHAALRRRAGFVTLLFGLSSLLACVLATVALSWIEPREEGAPVIVSGVGAGVNWLMLGIAILSLRWLPGLRVPRQVLLGQSPVHRPTLSRIVSVGWPIGAVVLLDSLAALLSQLLVGRFWLSSVPAHGIVVLLTSMCLVVPLGMAQAAVQQVAVLHAREAYRARNRVAAAAVLCGGAYGLAAWALFAVAPIEVASMLLGPRVHEPGTMALLSTIVPLGGITLGFQGIIVIAAAVLRGVGETRGPLVQALLGYVVVAGGGQILFAFGLRLGVVGIWWGLVVGFGAIAAAVTYGVYRRFGAHGVPVPPRGAFAESVALPNPPNRVVMTSQYPKETTP